MKREPTNLKYRSSRGGGGRRGTFPSTHKITDLRLYVFKDGHVKYKLVVEQIHSLRLGVKIESLKTSVIR